MNRPALVGKHGALLYSEFEQCVVATALLLEQAGVQAGDRVALLIPGDWRYPLMLLALVRLGAVSCPLNVRMSEKRAVASIAAMGCRFAVLARSSTRYAHAWGVEKLALEDLTGFTGKMVKSNHPHLPLTQEVARYPVPKRGGSDIVHSVTSQYYGARGVNLFLKEGTDNRWLHPYAWHEPDALHVLFCCLLSGAAMAIPPAKMPLSAMLKEYDPAVISLRTTDLEACLEAGKAVGGRKDRMVLLQENPPRAMLPAMNDSDFRFVVGYWPVCAAGPVTLAWWRPGVEHRGTPLRYREIQVSSAGRILVRGPAIVARSVGEAAPEGWVDTGDAGSLDEAGCLTLEPNA
jgi:hypothetical protein